jgi:UDP-N-acetylmuramate dehydrogenase
VASGAVEDAARILGPLAQRDVAIGPLTTYRVGGPADLFVEITDKNGLRRVSEAVRASGVPVLVVGRGSNLLVADAGHRGVALTLGGTFAEIDVTGVGGAVRMNAGGHGSDISESITDADVLDLATGTTKELDADALALGYRTSSIEPHQVVLAADFELAPGDREVSEAQIAGIVRWRRENQPGGSNAGSVFTNPPGDSAGRLIDAAGLKGHRVGSAHVSPKHANFFQADEGGSADDVLALIEEVQRLVEERMGVKLHPELRLIGFAQ